MNRNRMWLLRVLLVLAFSPATAHALPVNSIGIQDVASSATGSVQVDSPWNSTWSVLVGQETLENSLAGLRVLLPNANTVTPNIFSQPMPESHPCTCCEGDVTRLAQDSLLSGAASLFLDPTNYFNLAGRQNPDQNYEAFDVHNSPALYNSGTNGYIAAATPDTEVCNYCI
jgi:hypothetical protein